MANFHKDEWFQEQLQRHWDWGVKYIAPNEIIAVLYTGSGNYNCDEEESDCDSWIIYFDKNYEPSIYQVEQISHDGEVSWVCDIRAFIYGCLQGDWMYTIAYFTKYSIINPHYADLWHELYAKREKVAYVSRQNATEILKSNAKSYINTIVNLTHEKPHKRVYYMKLISFLYNAYYHRQPIGSCFYNENYAQELIRLKGQTGLSREELYRQAVEIGKDFIDNKPLSNNPKIAAATARETIALIPRFERRANNG